MFVLFLCAVVLQVTEAVGRLLYELFAVHRHLDIIVCLPKYLCFNVVALQYYVDHRGYFDGQDTPINESIIFFRIDVVD